MSSITGPWAVSKRSKIQGDPDDVSCIHIPWWSVSPCSPLRVSGMFPYINPWYPQPQKTSASLWRVYLASLLLLHALFSRIMGRNAPKVGSDPPWFGKLKGLLYLMNSSEHVMHLINIHNRSPEYCYFSLWDNSLHFLLQCLFWFAEISMFVDLTLSLDPSNNI